MLPFIGFPWFMSEKRDFSLYCQDALELLPRIPDHSVDLIVTDPPYFLSNGGTTCQSGRRVPVDKGEWDQSMGIEQNHTFNTTWLAECKRILKPEGSLFVSGTHHVIFSIGFAMQQLEMKILNEITWYKVNPPPNLACRTFTHATEKIIWAAPNTTSRHYFDYHAMKEENGGKQMQDIWAITPPRRQEKRFGRHPTQKPLELLLRIVRAASPEGALVLDPFSGSGTTGIACALLERSFIGIELNPEYLEIAKQRYLHIDEESSFVEYRALKLRKASSAARSLRVRSPKLKPDVRQGNLFDALRPENVQSADPHWPDPSRPNS